MPRFNDRVTRDGVFMNAPGFEKLIYEISLLLLYPVLILLGLSFLRVVWQLGELLHDARLLRRHSRPETSGQLRSISGTDVDSLLKEIETIRTNREQHPLVRRFAAALSAELKTQQPATLRPRINHLISQFEAELARDVNHVRILIRLGPCLGLAGTLIPLGPGLTALSRGDLSELSSRLVVAFSTTVVGLLVGGVSYVVALVRAHIADRLAGDLELIGDSVCLLTDSSSADRETPANVSPGSDFDTVLQS